MEFIDSDRSSLAKDNTVIKLNLTILFVISLFILNETIRTMISEKIRYINFPFIIFCTFLLFRALKKINVKLKIIYMVVIFSVFFILTIINSNMGLLAAGVSSFIFPLILISIKIKHHQAISSLRTFNKVFNPIIVLLLLLGIIDYITHSSIQLFLAQKNFPYADLIYTEHSWGIYRYYSIIGHPLQTANYFLIFFIMNNIYSKYEKPLIKGYLTSIITILGLLLCGSKTALVVGVILVLFLTNIKKFKWFYVAMIIITLATFLNTSLFKENIGQRFQSADLSSGRNQLISTYMYELKNHNVEAPGFFIGGGEGYSREIVTRLNVLINNFEYPSLIFAYDYGIFPTLIIYILIFIYPIMKFIRKKQFYILICFIGLATYTNTNNGIANLGMDAFAQLCFVIFILINLKKYEKT